MSQQKFTDQELIHFIQTGSPTERNSAWAYIYQQPKWQRTVMGWVTKGGGNEEDARDVMHAGFAEFEKNIRLRKFDGRSSLDTYLISICKNIWFKKARRKSQDLKLKEKLIAEKPTVAYDVVTDLERSQKIDMEQRRKEILHELIARLGAKCQQYLRYYMLDFSATEIAEAMELKNDNQARKSTFQCRKRLRELIESDPELEQFLKNRDQ